MRELDQLFAQARTAVAFDLRFVVRDMRFRLGVLSPDICARIFYAPGTETFSFETSHLIRKARRSEPAAAASDSFPTEAAALREAIRSVVEEYESAVRDGELPTDAWLVRNEHYL